VVHRMKSFIAECNRRHVFRVAALYIVGAWAVLQVADLAFEAWDIPSSTLRFVWICAALGLPIALIFGWRFDVIGGHILPTQDDGQTGDVVLHRTDYLILSAFSLVVIAMVFGLGREITSIREPQPAPLAAQQYDPGSIAVLPFKDTGEAAVPSDVLAVGIQDDLLTRLSKIGSLKVISRTSVDRYRGTMLTMPEIGAELGVGKILEGGVQRVGDQIRINVQLIDTLTDEHIWAESYDRRYTANSIFDLQTEIVETITKQLQANLTPAESQKIASMPTRNLAAYTVYLKGKNLAGIETIESLNAAIEEFNTAVEMDPEFALAYVGLADAYLTLDVNFLGGLTLEESLRFAEPPLTRALEIDPELGQAYATLGMLRQQQYDFDAAEEAYQKAIELQPNYSRVFGSYGRLRLLQGRQDEAGEFFRDALELDPYSAAAVFQYARYLDTSGDFDAAMDHYLLVAAIEPDHAFTYVYIAALHFLVYGQVDESLIWYQKAAQHDSQSPSLQAAQVISYLELGDVVSARYWVGKAQELGPDTFWPMWASMLLNLYTDQEFLALQDARHMLEVYPQNPGALNVLRNYDMKAGRYQVARDRYARAFRELVEPEIPQVNNYNYKSAVDLVPLLIKLGEQSRADDILQQSIELIQTMPRLGVNGYFVTDVYIYALQNQPEQALDALQQAIDEGYRLLIWLYLEIDPNVDSLRDFPRFTELIATLKTDLAEQAQRVRALKESGEIAPLALDVSELHDSGASGLATASISRD
jgi:TolB-like protein/tetratricopeptide (TPR) repeat protein